MVLPNRKKKTLKKGGVRRSTRDKKPSLVSRESENTRKRTQYEKEQRRLKTLEALNKRRARQELLNKARQNMQQNIGTQQMQTAAASAIADETDPNRRIGHSQKNFYAPVGTVCAARSRSEVKVPAPPYQLKYAIEVATTIVNNDFLKNFSESNPDIKLIYNLSERLLRHTQGKWDATGKVPNTWVCWLCGTRNISIHEAEHVIPQFEMTFDQGIFSRSGQGSAGLTKEDANRFINSLTDITMFNRADVKRNFLTIGLLIAEMVPSDKCCNQVKLDALFTSVDKNGDRFPSNENIRLYLDTLWEKVFNTPSYTQCGATDRDKLGVYGTKENFIQQRIPRITEFVQDICHILNSPDLYPGIDRNLLRIINCASAMITDPLPHSEPTVAPAAAAKMDMSGTLQTTQAEQAEIEAGAQILSTLRGQGGSNKKHKKRNSRKSKTRKSKTNKSKTNKSKTIKRKTRKRKTNKSKS